MWPQCVHSCPEHPHPETDMGKPAIRGRNIIRVSTSDGPSTLALMILNVSKPRGKDLNSKVKPIKSCWNWVRMIMFLFASLGSSKKWSYNASKYSFSVTISDFRGFGVWALTGLDDSSLICRARLWVCLFSKTQTPDRQLHCSSS